MGYGKSRPCSNRCAGVAGAADGREAVPWRRNAVEVFAEVEGKVGHRWYLWVTRSPSVVFFRIAPSRGAAVPKDHFAKLHKDLVDVVLVCDRYSAYKTLAKEHDEMIWPIVGRMSGGIFSGRRGVGRNLGVDVEWSEDIRTLYRPMAHASRYGTTVPLDATTVGLR